MEELGRYYTEDLFSKLLIENIGIEHPTNILELGVGGGSLLRAAYRKWDNAAYFVSDIDRKSLSKIKIDHPFVNSFHFDTVKDDIGHHLGTTNREFDIAICNPPYLKMKNDEAYVKLFKKAGLHLGKNLKVLTTDIVFLAKNLLALRSHGQLGIILPDGIMTGKEFEPLRESLIGSHNIKAIIQLPEKIFKKTEALTHILIVEKNVVCQKIVPLFLANVSGEIQERIDVANTSLIKRMDFKYHCWESLNDFKDKNIKTLAEYDISVRRGNSTHKDLKSESFEFMHTTNMPNLDEDLSVCFSKFNKKKFVYATNNDILISRVGKVGKVVRIKDGEIPITDCIYVLKIEKEIQSRLVYKALTSPLAEAWFRANAHGVCAKVISKKDLMEFPVR